MGKQWKQCQTKLLTKFCNTLEMFECSCFAIFSTFSMIETSQFGLIYCLKWNLLVVNFCTTWNEMLFMCLLIHSDCFYLNLPWHIFAHYWILGGWLYVMHSNILLFTHVDNIFIYVCGYSNLRYLHNQFRSVAL